MKTPQSSTASLHNHRPSREFLPVWNPPTPSPSSCFLIGWGNVGNFMWSLSQPPGRPDPPLAVWLPRRAGRQSGLGECSTGRVSWARALGGLGNSKLCNNCDWKLGAVRHLTLPKRGGSGLLKTFRASQHFNNLIVIEWRKTIRFTCAAILYVMNPILWPVLQVWTQQKHVYTSRVVLQKL